MPSGQRSPVVIGAGPGRSQPPEMGHFSPQLRLCAMTPGDLHSAVQSAFNNGDVDSLVDLYEDDAWLFGPSGPVQGTDAIRGVWNELLAMTGSLQMVTQYVVEKEDMALLSNRWTSTIGDDELSAVTAEVARRQSDGTWKYIFDNPDAAGILAV